MQQVVPGKAQPGRLDYGSGGNGSAAHLATKHLKLQTGTFIVQVPSRGAAPAVSDLVAGQTDQLLTGAPALISFIKSGQLRAVGVSSKTSLPALPDVPTVAKSVCQGFEADQQYGVVAPAGTPEDIVRQLNTHINQALSSPELKAQLMSEGAIVVPTTPEAYGALIRREVARWKPVVKAGNIQPNER